MIYLDDVKGWTALIYAAFYDHPAVVELLLTAGADATIKDEEVIGATHIYMSDRTTYRHGMSMSNLAMYTHMWHAPGILLCVGYVAGVYIILVWCHSMCRLCCMYA